jgi:hypothetical protein
MPLLAETLVDEWLNRKGFFTIRGIKDGVDEMDLLGVRPTPAGLEGWHVEVQVSFRPVSYIAKLTKELQIKLNKKPNSAWARPPEILDECIRAWISHKFTNPNKIAARARAWPDIQWRHYFVHGVVKYEAELTAIKASGITLVSLDQVLTDICTRVDAGSPGAAGTDLADIIDYYESRKPKGVA